MVDDPAFKRLLDCGSGLFTFPDDTAEERHIAASWAAINASWGSLELGLWRAFAPINAALAQKWAANFFESDEKKSRRVKAALEAIAPEDKYFQDLLAEALARIKCAKEARNPLMHGVWRRERVRIAVLLLRVDEAGVLADPIVVTPMLLSDIERRIKRAVDALSNLGSECLAHSWLEDFARKRSAGRSYTNGPKE
jgi:hypothetical protein